MSFTIASMWKRLEIAQLQIPAMETPSTLTATNKKHPVRKRSEAESRMKISFVLCSVITISALGQAQSVGTATASGTCSVANAANNSTFTINCGIGREQGQKILTVLNKILSKKLDPDAVMWRLDVIGSNVETIKQNEALTAAQIELIAKEVAEIKHGNASGKVLIKVTADLTGNLRDFPLAWKDSVHDVELYRDEFFRYRQPPMTNKAEIDAANKFLDDRLAQANSSRKLELSFLLQNAAELCETLLTYIPKENQTEDRNKQQEISQLRGDMWKWEAYSGYDSALNSLADYLDALAKRVASE
jgi:hypothetical protein